MSSKARVDASLRVVHTSGPLALPPAGCHRLNSPRIGLWTSLCRSSWGLHMFFSPTLSAEGQGLATPTDTLPLTHEGHKHISCCVESVTLHIGTHISCIYCLCSKSLAFNWSRAMSTKLPYSVFPLICCTHARTHTHTHAHTLTDADTTHCILSISLFPVGSWTLKHHRGDVDPVWASVCNTTASAESLPQGICPAKQLCMQSSLFKKTATASRQLTASLLNWGRDDNPVCYLCKHI